MKKAISFLSEHSIELILAPKFAEILSDHYSTVIPFYYCSTREGTSISKICDKGERYKVISLFPRRPKLEAPFKNNILIKFNKILFDRAKFLNGYKIPSYAGFPVINSILQFQYKNSFAWFKINAEQITNEDITINITVSHPINYNVHNHSLLGPMNKEMLLHDINNYQQSYSWADIIDLLKKFNDYLKCFEYSRSFFYVPYKPIYFLIQE